MKTILFNTPFGEDIPEPLPVRPIPDSAILANRRPFFIPDFDDRWICTPAVAFRISRLGKSVGTKFASRYFDAMTLVARSIPVTLSERIEAGSTYSDLAFSFDGALLAGDWIPLPDTEAEFPVSIGDFSFSCSLAALNIDSAIHAISDYMMLKMGDIIIPATFPHTAPLAIGSHLEGSLNGVECFSFRIK